MKSSIPVMSAIFLLETSKLLIELIFAVVTTPSIGAVSYPKSIRACSKLASGIEVVCAIEIAEVSKRNNEVRSNFFIFNGLIIRYLKFKENYGN